jgi:D-apiose dehydrogenase
MRARPLSGILIGAGYFANFHAEAWQRVSGAHLVAVADVNFDRAQNLAQSHDIPSVYTSLGEALEQHDADFVDIVTPPDSHWQLTRAAAERRLHVICQKPMAASWEQCLQMCEVCHKHHVRLLMHENWRWQPWYRAIKTQLAQGSLGDIAQISFFWRTGDGRGVEPYPAQPYFREMPRLLVYESLVHILDTFRYLLGEIVQVCCRNRRINPIIVGEDHSLISLQFGSGVLGLIDANRLTGPVPAPVAMGTLRIEGTDGTLQMRPDGSLWFAAPGLAEQRLPFEPPTEGYKGDSVFATQQHFADCLRTGQPSESDGTDYLHTVALVEACYQSAASGHMIEL